ncbi:glycosyltransferase [Marinobacter sp. JSM 1782161]|uniref:glycosyltransferase n=1 Tax=Marinobacter sp. JSM 1782161 TaxID=2685906 RepID=UPI0014033563|nr:glycosyltransferase [Marinobacter sp. JSM 1782161]
MKKSDRSRLTFYPRQSKNPYLERMLALFAAAGKVEPRPLSLRSIILPSRTGTIFFLNWIENLAVIGSIPGLVATILFVKIIKMRNAKLIWVKHNIYPHSSGRINKDIARACQNFVERNADAVICHGKKHSSDFSLRYVPHPLPVIKQTMRASSSGDYYICFGRMMPYKNIDRLIRDWPKNMKLVISGEFSANYYKTIFRLCQNLDNISLENTYLSDQELAERISFSKGVIIPNDGNTSIISGGILLGLSLGKPTFTKSRRMFEEFDANTTGLYLISDWCDIRSKVLPTKNSIIASSRKIYGDDAIKDRLRQILKDLSQDD